MGPWLRLSVCGALAALVPAPTLSQSRAPAKTATHHVFVSVLDRQGVPLLDLGPADFSITEAGTTRRVVDAGLAKSPLLVALLVDTSDDAAPALVHLRAGLVAFLGALPPEHEIMLVTMGHAPRVRVQPTLDRKKLKDAAMGLFTDGAGTALIDSLLEVDNRFMRKAEDRWPVFLIVTSNGNESSVPVHEKEIDAWTLALPGRSVTCHAITLKLKGNGLAEAVAINATTNSGGRYDFINTSNSLPDKLKAWALELADDYANAGLKYQVDFETDSREWKPVEVVVARNGVRIQISQGRLR